MSEFNDEEIPRWLKWFFITVNRVGFPVVAFVLMWYICQVSIAKVVVSVDQNTIVLMGLKDALMRIENRLR
jgi:hypothetical protein